jgi:hypothetical protein
MPAAKNPRYDGEQEAEKFEQTARRSSGLSYFGSPHVGHPDHKPHIVRLQATPPTIWWISLLQHVDYLWIISSQPWPKVNPGVRD